MQRGSLHLSSCRPSNAEVVIPLYDESFRFPNIIMDVTDDAASSFQGGRNSPEQVFPADSIKVLPTTFVPGEWDVICQRGRQNYYHIGTRRFRSCINNYLNGYVAAKTKKEKSMVVTTIVDMFQKNKQPAGGGFIRKDLLNNRWYEVAEKIAREKAGQALRDGINQKEQKKESGENEEEEESNSTVRKRRRLTGEDGHEDRCPFPSFLSKPTLDVGVTPPAASISLMVFQKQQQQDVATMMHSPLQFGGGFVRRNTAVRMEEVFSKMMSAERGVSASSNILSTSKRYQALEPSCRKMEDHRHQGAFPPTTHHDDNHLIPQWSLADLEPRPLLGPPFPRFATYKEGNEFTNSAGAVPNEDDRHQYDKKEGRGTCQKDYIISPEGARSY